MAFCTSALGQDPLRAKKSPPKPGKRGTQAAAPKEELQAGVLALGSILADVVIPEEDLYYDQHQS